MKKIAMTVRKLSETFVDLAYEDLHDSKIKFAAKYDPKIDRKRDASDWYCLQVKRFGDNDATVIGLSEIGMCFCGSFILDDELEQYDEEEYESDEAYAAHRVCELITGALDCGPESIVLAEFPKKYTERVSELIDT